MNKKLNKLLEDKRKKALAKESELIKGMKILKGQPGKKGKDGKDGKDGVSPDRKGIIQDVLSRIPIPSNGKDSTVPGPKGDKGDRGPVGPIPKHRWEKTKLQFENPDGSWGTFVDLQGEKGKDGKPPEHQVNGLKIRFRNPDGTWGEYIDLKPLVMTAIGSISRNSGGYGGPVSFLDLSDTPDTYDGAEGKFLKVVDGRLVFASGGGSGGGISSVEAGINIEVNDTDPDNPIISLSDNLFDDQGSPTISIDLSTRALFDATGENSVNWNDRLLRNVDQGMLDWSGSYVTIFGAGASYGSMLDSSLLTDARLFAFPDQDGTLALLSQVPDPSDFVLLTGDQSIGGHKYFLSGIYDTPLSNTRSIDTGNRSLVNDQGDSTLYWNEHIILKDYQTGVTVTLDTSELTSSRVVQFQDKNGVIALLSDITGGNKTTVDLDFGSGFSQKAQTVVSGQTWVEADSCITAQVKTPDGVDPDEMFLLGFHVVISDIVVGTGFTVTLYSEAEASGIYEVMCIGV